MVSASVERLIEKPAVSPTNVINDAPEGVRFENARVD
jgi:hypothetical protein